MRRSSLFIPKELGAAALLGFAVGCAVIAVTERSAAYSAPAAATLVDRTHKGDRLPLVSPPQRQSSGLAPRLATPSHRPPLGCDPAFSPVADPASARVYLRCLS